MNPINRNTPPATVMKIGGDPEMKPSPAIGGDPFPLLQNFLDAAGSIAGNAQTGTSSASASGGGLTPGVTGVDTKDVVRTSAEQQAPKRIHSGTTPFYVDLGGSSFTIQAQTSPGTAPEVSWGAGWTRVQGANGTSYMKHTSGAQARVTDQVRLVVSRPSKVSIVSTSFGSGKMFPDGTVVIPGMGANRKPYRINPEGTLEPLAFGKHTFGGVSVDILNVAVVRVKDARGTALKYDSRGLLRYPRATAGAATHSVSGAAGIGVTGGGPMSAAAQQIKTTVESISTIARSILEQVEAAGGADPKSVASVRSLLDGLPAALSGALAGMSHSSGFASGGGGGQVHAATFTPASPSDLFLPSNPHPPRAPKSGESVNQYLDAIMAEYRAAARVTSEPPAQPPRMMPPS